MAAADRWRVNTTTLDGWEVGYCRVGRQKWMRIWIRRPGRVAQCCTVQENGSIIFESRALPREDYDVLLAAVDQADEHDPGVYCHGCSEAGGADQPIYHLPPVCSAPAPGASAVPAGWRGE